MIEWAPGLQLSWVNDGNECGMRSTLGLMKQCSDSMGNAVEE